MVPPPSVALNPNVTELVEVVVMSPVTAVEFVDITQTGMLPFVFAQFIVQEVTMPAPTVMTPAVSVPKTEGELPHVPMPGVVPEEMRSPSYLAAKVVVPFWEETVSTKSVATEAGVELTETNATPVGTDEMVTSGPVVAPVTTSP